MLLSFGNFIMFTAVAKIQQNNFQKEAKENEQNSDLSNRNIFTFTLIAK